MAKSVLNNRHIVKMLEKYLKVCASESSRWEKLWKWTIYALVGMFLAVPVSSLLGLIGLLLLLAAMIAAVVCGVLNLIYLHRMIEAFRWYLDRE